MYLIYGIILSFPEYVQMFINDDFHKRIFHIITNEQVFRDWKIDYNLACEWKYYKKFIESYVNNSMDNLELYCNINKYIDMNDEYNSIYVIIHSIIHKIKHNNLPKDISIYKSENSIIFGHDIKYSGISIVSEINIDKSKDIMKKYQDKFYNETIIPYKDILIKTSLCMDCINIIINYIIKDISKMKPNLILFN